MNSEAKSESAHCEGRLLELYVMPGRVADEQPIQWSRRERGWFSPGFYHCLPLQFANQMGWTVVAPESFAVVWDGRSAPEGLKVRGCALVVSHFGHGIFTYTPPFVFRSSEGIGLLVKAVPNLPKDGVWPLEGFVETDNLRGSFTFNFKITRPGAVVSYTRGEPLAQILPYPRHWLETIEPRVVANGDRYYGFMYDVQEFGRKREERLKNVFDWKAARDWNYFKGIHQSGGQFPDHQGRLQLREFKGDPEVAGKAFLPSYWSRDWATR
jgi:hypothetical protein